MNINLNYLKLQFSESLKKIEKIIREPHNIDKHVSFRKISQKNPKNTKIGEPHVICFLHLLEPKGFFKSFSLLDEMFFCLSSYQSYVYKFKI